MRTTGALMTRQSVYLMQSGFSRMSRYRLQLSSGQRMLDFGMDPTGLSQSRRYRALEAANQQYQRNLQNARTFLDGTDAALQGVSDHIIRLKEVMIRETGPLGTDDTNSQAIKELESIRDSVLALMNQEVEGRHIFGGYRTTVTPFTLTDDVVSYNGDDNLQRIQISSTLHLPINIAGSDVMGADSATLLGSSDLKPRVLGSTALSSLNEGAGGTFTSIGVSLGGGAITSVDLSGATTVQDVLDAINGAGVGVTARISDDETGITLDSALAFEVFEVGGGTAAADLGIVGASTGMSLEGTDVRGALTDAVHFSQLRELDGEWPLGILRIRVGGVDTDINLSGASDLGDVRTHILNNISNMSVDIKPEGTVELTMNVPETFEVSSPNGDSTASILGIAGQASPGRLFDLFQVVIDALESGDRDYVRQHLVEVDDVHETIRNLLITVGGRQSLADQTEELLRQREESLIGERSRIEDTDIVDAATRLSYAETAYQAALASTARMFDLALVHYL